MIISFLSFLSICFLASCATFNSFNNVPYPGIHCNRPKTPPRRPSPDTTPQRVKTIDLEILKITEEMASLSECLVDSLLTDILKEERLSKINFLQEYEITSRRTAGNQKYFLTEPKIVTSIQNLEFGFRGLFGPELFFCVYSELDFKNEEFESEMDAVDTGSKKILAKVSQIFQKIRGVSINLFFRSFRLICELI